MTIIMNKFNNKWLCLVLPILFIFIGLPNILTAQNLHYKIQKFIDKPEVTESGLKALNINLKEYLYQNPDSVLFFSNRIIQIVAKHPNKELICYPYKYYGKAYQLLGELDSALKYSNKFVILCSKYKLNTELADGLYNRAFLYRKMGDYQAAVKDFLQCSRLAVLNKDEGLKYYAILGLAVINSSINNDSGAIDNYRSIIESSYAKTDTSLLSSAYMNIGNVYSRLKKYDLAKVYYLKAVHLFQLKGDYFNLGKLYQNLANNLYVQGLYTKAMEFLQQSTKYRVAIKDNDNLAENYYLEARIFFQLNVISKADKATDLAISMVASNDSKEFLADLYKLKSELSETKGQWQDALNYYKLSTDISDSIYSIEKIEAINELQAKYNSEKSAREIEKLTSRNRTAELELQYSKSIARQNFYLAGFLLAVVMVVMAIAILYYFISYKRKKLNRLLQLRNLRIKQQTTQIAANNLELLKANATRDRLFSIIAHDLRGPIGALKYYPMLIRTNIIKQNLDKAIKQSDELELATEKLNVLTLNLLNWAQSQSGNLKLKPDKLQIQRLVVGVFENLETVAYQKSIILNNSVSPDIYAFADETTITTVLRNILSNAIKFTQINGKIVIVADVLGKEVSLKVIDNGIGMPYEILSKVFSVDRSKVAPGTQGELGSGIGLNVCHDFVLMNNGRIAIDSKVDIGTTVTIWLPIEDPTLK